MMVVLSNIVPLPSGIDFELRYQRVDLFHVMGLDDIPHVGGASIGISSSVADRVDIGLLFVFWQGSDLRA